MGKRHIGFDIWWPEQPASWGFLRRYLVPHPGTLIMTLLLVGGVLWAGSVGAIPLRAPAAATTSTGTIAYQGRLADSAGTPITDTVNMEFRLYDVAEGSAPLWSELWTGSNAVRVSDGLFNVMLGSLEPIPQEVVAGNDQLWLGITVGTDDEMTPRVQLGSVPFAVQAASVKLPSVHEFTRDGVTTIPAGAHAYVGDAQITLARPGKIFAQCDMTLRPTSVPINWVGLKVIARKNGTVVGLADNAYSGASESGHTSWSVAGILDLPESGAWTIQCDMHRSRESADPIVHTYSITAFQVE